jgi:type IV secretory pathway ATPase VirB11/archaellum biosynthesis ATPase
MVDARLPDGSRVNAIIPPLALDGPSLSIRRFGTGPVAGNQLVELKSITAEMLEVLSAAARARLSILISGGTGSGKTTLLNILSRNIPQSERVITIEDAAELQLAQENIVRLETRPPNIEGQGAIRQRQLLINCLRMRPDRIILGEVRGEEAFDMLQAMNTGHEGSMATIHANTPRDALTRLESMVAMSGLNLGEKAVRQQISSAISLVVQVSRMSDGSRKVVSITEITGMEENIISMQEIFTFIKKGIGPDGKVVGAFTPSRIRPRFLERIQLAGISLPQSVFETSCSLTDCRERVCGRWAEQASARHTRFGSGFRHPGIALSDCRFPQERTAQCHPLDQSQTFEERSGAEPAELAESGQSQMDRGGVASHVCRLLCAPGISDRPENWVRPRWFAGRISPGIFALWICALPAQ